MNIDLRKDAPAQSDIINPEELSVEIEKLQSIYKHIEQKEKEMKELKEDEKVQSGIIIPQIMERMNLSTLKLRDGSEVSVKQIYGASIKADKKVEAINWLRDNGMGDIVKNEITVMFGRDEDNKAQQYATLARGQGYEPQQKVAVHASTLRLVLEERNKNKQNIPEEYFHTFEGAQTKLKGKK
tara:strand:+ start:43 stop:591 length:549 start_codon:yes stop_codon:yes gene_type:complete